MPEANTALLIVRIALGSVMLAHGIRHAMGRERTTAWFGKIGFRAPPLQWMASTATELVVGVLLVVGGLTSLAAAGVVGIAAVAFWSVHRYAGFFVTARPDEGWEYVFTIAVVAGALAILGPGEWSVDDAVGIADALDGWVGGVLALAGVLVAAAQVATFYRPGSTAG